MFTGIIEATGRIERIENHGENRTFHLSSRIADELKTGESLAHNGVCLTVEPDEHRAAGRYRVTAIAQTLALSALGDCMVGDVVNLERALRADGRLDGHFVQGHVDGVGTILSCDDRDGSKEFWISSPPAAAALLVPRGSICVNGISLTISEMGSNRFSVNIIPHTSAATDAGQWVPGRRVNLEFDVLGKYIVRYLELRNG